MKWVVPGGTGQVGTLLARTLVRDGEEVVLLARHPRPAPCRVVAWDPAQSGAWERELDGADVVVNLAGRSVNCRYTAGNRREILESRTGSVAAVARAIAAARTPPGIWLQASTATIYAHRYDAPNDEASGRIGGLEPDVPETWRFSIDVATAWEAALDAAAVPGTRKVKLRSAMIMSPDRDGVLDTLLGLVRARLAGPVAGGRQYVSWIHETDFTRAIRFVVERGMEGAVNLASPHPLPYREFMAALRGAAGVKIGLPATRWMLEIGAFVLRTESELVLKSRRVVPGRLLDAGFEFAYPRWPEAAADLVARAGPAR